MTVEAFEAFVRAHPDGLYELLDGVIVEKPMPTEEHGVIVLSIGALLLRYVRQHRTGYVATETRHRVAGEAHTVLMPDVSYRVTQEPPVRVGSVPQLPDLAVEVKLPDDSYKSMREKAYRYLAHGTRLVWLVYPEKRKVEVLTHDDFELLGEGDVLTGGDVLAGFAVPVADIFQDMVGDPPNKRDE